MGNCVQIPICKSKAQRLRGEQLIIYIREKGKKYQNEESKQKKRAKKIRYLKYKDINEKCCYEYQKSNFDSLFGNNYKTFIKYLFMNINQIEDINRLLGFYKNEESFLEDKIVCYEFEKAFESNKVYIDETNVNELKNFVLIFLNFLTINESEKIYEILSFITNNFKTKDLIEICIPIINKESSNLELRKKLIKDLVNKSFKEKFETYEILEDLFEKLNKSEDIEIFFNVLNENYCLKKDDFFKKQNPPNIIFFYKMVITDNYKEKMINYPFFQKNNNIIKNIYIDIIELKIKFNELENLYNLNKDNNINERIYLFCEGDENYMDELKKNINENYENFRKKKNEYITKINSILSYINFYFKDYWPEKINQYSKKINIFNELNLKDINIDNSPEFNELYERAKLFNQFSPSISFAAIYELQLNNNDFLNSNKINEILDISYNEFQTLIHLLKGNFKLINHLIIPITKKMNTEEKIKKELQFLKNYFKIDDLLDITEIENKLIFYINQKRNQYILKYLKELINDFSVNKTSTFNEIEKNYLQMTKSNLQFNEIISIYESINNLSLKFFNSKFSSQNIINLYQYCSKEDDSNKKKDEENLVQFLIKVTNDQIERLNEFLEDDEINFMDLKDLEDCNKFIKKIKSKISSQKTDNNLIKIFIEESEKEEQITLSLENIGSKFYKIKEKYESNFDIEKSKVKQIKLIYQHSTFNIKKLYQKYYCEVSFENQNQSINKSFEEILELRDWALLRNNSQKIENVELYVKLPESIKIIENIIKYINLISSKGYPNELKYLIEINNGYAIEIIMFKEIKIIENELKNFAEIQDKKLKEVYKNNPNLRLIDGRNFNKIYDLVNNKINKVQIESLNKFLTNKKKLNDKSKPIPNIKYNINDMNNLEENLNIMYKTCNDYIEQLYKENNLNLKKIYNNECKKKDLKDIQSSYFNLNEIDIAAIQIFLQISKELPNPQNILYCNLEITKEEIISFTYRALLCEFHGLFLIIKPENLNKENKTLLAQILKNELKDIKMISCLIILYYDQDSDIVNEIKKIPIHNNLPKFNIKNFNLKSKSKIKVYSSEQTGLGKSTLIKNSFLDKKLNYIYFPIGGDISRKQILQRLNNLQLKNNQKIGFHLDLYDTNQVEIISEFLFSILITKCYHLANEEIFYFNDELKIKIEIPDNALINFLDIFPILQLFEQNLIKKNVKLKLNFNQDITSNFQVCFNYLHSYTNNLIDENNIIIPGISLNNNGLVIQVLPLNICEMLLNQYLKIDNPNYYQINSFISILGEEFKILSNNIYLNVEEIKIKLNNKNNLNGIRSFFIQCLIEVTKHFIKGAYDDIIKEQNQVEKIVNNNENNDNTYNKNLRALISTKKVSFDKVDPSLIIFNDDKQSITIIATCNKNTSYYSKLKSLYNSQNQSENNEKDCIDYNKLTSKEYYFELQKVLNLINREIEQTDKEYNNKIYSPISEIVSNYVFTSDNFIKLILIIIRLRAKIPVIMMGETGCGKTSLIRIIYDLKEKYVGLKEGMLILNIHAGIVDQNIIDWMYNNNLMDYNNNNNNYKEETKWVFFDEINTCNSMGLLSEILCKHTMLGRPIKKNIVFIAACNPYRTYEKNREIIGLFDSNKYKKSNLVYTVNPLPTSLLNFVFDFGSIKSDDEKKYIHNMIFFPFEKIISNEKLRDEMVNIAEKVIFEAHNFIRRNNDESSVSLREVNRFIILFQFFLNFLENRKDNNMNNNIRDNYIGAINLSVYLCYFLRIYNKNIRREFIKTIHNFFGNNFNFENLPNKIQEEIVEELNIDIGYAKNKALLENIFSLFVCIINKIPLFIVGKPGCSKSLSTSLIFHNMRGVNSNKNLFKKYPRVISFYYQGSLSSTSEGIQNIFTKARKTILNDKNSKEILPIFYFDEMGLAELSKNNPLKAIHSELEYDENKGKISFVGISNWSLDASKMNRGIFISIPEPDKDDLILTALKIGESYNDILVNKYKEYYENLAKAYFDYKKSIDVNDMKNNNFHGLRDFYHIIKLFSRKIIENKFTFDIEVIKMILNSIIVRNFGGKKNSIDTFKQNYSKYDKNFQNIQFSILRCIYDNLEDYESRFLLIISKSSMSKFLIESILKNIKKNYKISIGSTFENDLKMEFYSVKKLNEIQSYLYNDNVLVLKNLESIYPSLYDLFNQNFKQIGDRKYTRIALGYSNSMYQPVNNKFRCIILVDPEEIEKQDPPFLNRFEKQFFSFEYLINDSLKQEAQKLYRFLHDIVELKNESKKNKNECVDLENQLINSSIEEIHGYLYYFSNQNDSQNEIFISTAVNTYEKNKFNLISNNEDNFTEKIIQNFSQDIITFMSFSGFDSKYHNLEIIKNIYRKQYHQNIKLYLQNIFSHKHVIYTFSNILDPIFDNNDNDFVENNKFGNFSLYSSKIFKIGNFDSEREIEDELVDFFENKRYNLCIFQFENNNCIHLNHIKYLIENKFNEENKNKKVIIFIIYVKRILKNSQKKKEHKKINTQYLIPLISDFQQIFIDDLIGKTFLITDLFEKEIENLFSNKELIDIDSIFESSLYYIFTLTNHVFLDHLKNENYENQYIEYWINYLKRYKQNINNIIFKNITKNINKTFFSEIFYLNIFKENDTDLISVISNYLTDIYKEIQIKIILKLEKSGYFPVYINHIKNNFNVNLITQLKDELIENIDIDKFKYNLKLKGNKIFVLDNLKFPCSLDLFQETKNYLHSIKNSYLENDELFRNNKITLEDYQQNKIYYENALKNEFLKYDIIQKLEARLVDLNKYNFSHLINDYLEIFIRLDKGEIKDENKYFNKNVLDFLNLIIEKLNLNSDDYIIYLCKIILWFESYSNYIMPIIPIYFKLSNLNDNFLNQFKNNILRFNQFEDIINYNEDTTQYNETNKIFYILYETLIKIIFDNSNSMNFFTDDELYQYSLNLENFANILWLAQVNLNVNLKSFFNLLSYTKTKDILIKEGKRDKLAEYISIINTQFLNIKNNDLNAAIKYLEEEHEFLKQNISNSQLYSELIIQLFLYKISLTKEYIFKKKILEIIISDNQLLIKSKIIFHVLLNDINLIPNFNNSNDLNNFPPIDKFKNNNLLQFLNTNNNIFLDEILIQFFESLLSSNFSEIPENDLFNITFILFSKSVEYIEEQQFIINDINKVLSLYCIVFIKYFCNILAIFIVKNIKFQIKNFNQFFLNKQNNFRKVICFYILKVIYFSLNNSYENLKDMINPEKEEFKWANKINLRETFKFNITFLFININNTKIIEEFIKQFTILQSNNYIENNKEISDLIGKNGFDDFYDLILNKIISNLNSKKYMDENYEKVCKYLKNILKKIEKNTKNLLELFLDSKTYHNKMNLLINNLNIEDFEIILHSYKICYICSKSNINSFYYNLQSSKIEQTINNNFIPGGETTDELIVQNAEIIENTLKQINNYTPGVYICSCGYYYLIDACSKPYQELNCPICKLKIGGLNHILVKREGHFRLFLNQQQKSYVNPNFDCKLLSEFKEMINKKNQEFKGIKKVNIEFLKRQNKKIRELSQISYRLLNFIFYSNIFFGEKLGYLNNSQNYLLKDSGNLNYNVFELLKECWNLLKFELGKTGINQIQIYLNMIYPKLKELITNTSDMATIEKRKSFETQFNKYINDSLKNYNSYYDNYIKSNNNIQEIQTLSNKSIITESINPINIPENDYPLIKYFTFTKYPTKKSFEKAFELLQNKNIYPVLNSYFTYLNQGDFEKIQYLSLLNPFTLYMINRHSYNISRQDANKKTINDDLNEIRNNKIINMFENYKHAFDNLSKLIPNRDFLCHINNTKMKTNISLSDELSYCLNDIGEEKGMFLASLYHELIKIQNGFLESIENYANKNELSYLCQNMNKRIFIQEAIPNEIINFNIFSNIFISFDELISIFSYKKCFNVNSNQIIYTNYSEIEFDFDKINIEIGKILLPNKKKFKTSAQQKEEQIYVIYRFETFTGENTDIIQQFIEKYPQEKLSDNEKNYIENIVEKLDLKIIMFSIEMIIFYMINDDKYNSNSSIKDVFKSLPSYIIIKDDMRELFSQENLLFKHLIDIYDFIEEKNYYFIIDNIEQLYKLKCNIDENEIKNYFKEDNNNNHVIKIRILGGAIRKFISRYLTGTSKQKEINDSVCIFDYIHYKEEIWPPEIFNLDKFEEEINEIKEKFPVLVTQSIDFYDKLYHIVITKKK